MFINSSRVYLEKFVERAVASLAPGSFVLDAGAGDCPYYHLLKDFKYETADFCQVEGAPYGEITYVCDLRHIPVEDERYDLVLCTQVLEHLPYPDLVLNEIMRVLKPGKALWISAPLFYEEHQIPYDYYRYTRYGFTYLIEQAGFHMEKLDWLEGYYGTLAYQLRTAASALPVKPKDYGNGVVGYFGGLTGFLLRPGFRLLSHYFSRMDIRAKYTKAGLCKNYTAVAIKPPRSA